MSINKRLRKKYLRWLYVLPLMALILMAMSWFAAPSSAQQTTPEENTSNNIILPSEANELNTVEYVAPQEFTDAQMANLCFAISDGYFNEAGTEVKDSGANDTLAFLNRVTGQTKPVDGNVPNIEQTFNIEAMAFPPGAGVLYAANQGYLGTVNLANGDHSAVQNDAGGQAVHFGTGQGYRASSGSLLRSESFNDVDGLTFDAVTGVLWGADRNGDRPDILLQIDPVTGLHIPGVFPDPYNPGQFVDYVEVQPKNGLGDIDDIASHPVTGELYAIMNQGGGPSMLVTINTQTGETTEIGWYTRHNTGEVISDFEGLSFFNDGKLYGSTGKDFNDLNVLWQIDTTNAVATAVGEFTDRMIDVEALGCLTAPGYVVVEKSTNGVDADTEPGVYVPEGDPIVWDYFVRNTGGKVLYNVEVQDDQLGLICTIPSLDVGESNVDAGVTCQANGVSVFADRPYENIATVTGNDQVDGNGTVYSHSDPSHYYSYRPAAVGNYVWRDTNGNGVQDAFETGIPNATVELYDSNGALVSTMVTNEHGYYLFDELQPGTYSLKFILPAGYDGFTQQNQGDDTKDSDADPTTGVTASFPLVAGQIDLDWDAGVTGVGPDAALGDYVWEDSNANGIQDAGEPGIPGATVTLYKIGGTQVGTTTTDANGKYSFTGLEPSDYFVVFNQVSGYEFTTANVASDNAVDSDADIDYEDDPTRRRTSLITLNAGDNDLTWDAGFYRLGSIGDTIWKDDNADGVKDAGESGIAGVNVILKDANGNVVANVTTDANGNYNFPNLVPGTYTVSVDPTTLPADYGQTYDLDGTLDHQTTFVLTSGENKDDVDFAYLPATASLGNFVWNDTNANGVQDAGELGIENVTVTLHKASDDSVVGTTTTAADGSYAFTNLPAGEYYLVFTSPSGFATSPQDTTANGGTDANDSDIDPATGKTANITLTEGQNDDTWDAGFNQVGSIGDTIWSDTDGDGEQDAGEPGIAGVTVTLTDSGGNVIATATTDADGKYLFDNLPAGEYTITVDPSSLPASVAQTYDLDGTLDHTTTVTLAAQENRNDVDFGYEPQGTINGTIWQDDDTDGTIDSGEPNLGGITVELVDDQGNTIATTTTNPDGTYTFPNVPAGTYTVQVDPSTVPAGMAQTFDPDGTLNHSTPVSVTPGQTVNDINFGYVPGASVGNFVWDDTNRDGVQDAGEVGIAGVTVKLYNSNDELVGTTTTAADGSYNFTDLVPGDYYLVFDKPANYFASPQDAGSDNAQDSDASPINGQTAPFSLTAGQNDDTQDAGFYQIPNESSIGDVVWQDNNGDGVQDAGEPGIPGVKVILVDGDGNQVGSTTTDADGKYLFDNLPDDTYTVQVDPASLPGNLAPTFDLDGTSNPDHQATFPLGVGEDKLDVDFGYQPVGIIGGTIWDDQDPNGTQGPGEPGIPGVTVTLTDPDGNVVATTTTGPDGSYSFPNVPAGTYTVTVDPTTLPDGVILSFDPDGGDDSLATVTLTPGQTKDDVNFGYVAPASLGNFVWNDTNADGTQDSGETGIGDVTVKLLDSNNQVVATTTTAADGSYSFTNLLPGDYVVHFDHASPALDGMIGSPANVNADDSKDSDPDNTTGKTTTITLSPGENDDTSDAGFYAGASTGGMIWLDTDGDGTPNNGEGPIPSVTVTLTDPNGNVIATTTTDGDGNYVFEDLPPGDYIIKVDPTSLPTGVQQTGDPDGTNDNQTPITLAAGENKPDQNFGYQPAQPGVSIDKSVYAGHDSGASCTGTDEVVGKNGDPITFCFKVTNTGSTSLTNITISDAQLGITESDMTLLSGSAPLAAGQSMVYYYQSTVTGDITNTASASAEDPNNPGTPVTNDDTAKVDQIAPAINIETTVYPGQDGGASCPGSELVTGSQGDAVTYCFVVTNTGDTHLDNVTVTDPSLGGGLTLTSGTPLAPGESVTLFYNGNINGDLTNTATATGNPTDPSGNDLPNVTDPTDSDPAQVAEVVTASSVGDKIWRDNNGDGVQDADEPGIPGVTVTLFDANGNQVAQTTTDGNGEYLFDELPAGTYTIKVDPTTLPANLGQSFDLDGTLDHESTFSLGANEDKTDVDFGYKPLALIGGTIWDDQDPNGTQGPGEPGIPGVTVTLKDENGTVVATTTTGPDGSYSFPGVPTGTYTVTVDPTTLPADVILTFDPDGGDDSIATITVTDGEQKDDVNFGYVAPASLGDFVWNDTDADGVQDDGENGIADVTVTLLDDNNQVVATTTTAADGSYSFSNLLPGDYVVEFDHDSPALAGLIGSPVNQGADDAKDSDANKDTGKTGTINLSAGENDDTVDAGFYAGASTGGMIWLDTDGDGTPNNGEGPIPSVTVTLTDPAGNVIATTTTDSDGNYVFDDLPPGDYIIKVDPTTLPTGVQQTGDPDGTNDNQTPVTLTVGEDKPDQDFGYQPTGPSITLDTTVYPGHDSGALCTGVEKVIGQSGDAVTYCFKVTNTGNTPLSNITLNDPNLGITQADMTVLSGDPTTLQPGESVVFYYDGTITEDLVNTATVDATDPSNTPVTDSDPAEVDLVSAAIQIETTVYPGHDNGASCQGSELATGVQGAPVTYCFQVTNTGDTTLDDVTVNDPDLGITLVSGSPLAPGQTVTLIYEGPINGDLTNTATATGNPVDPNGTDLPNVDNPTDSDPAAVDLVAPSIQIENTVYAGHDDGASCQGSELVSGNNGDAVTYCFEITNNGDTPLSDIQLADPDLGVLGNVNGTLLPGQSVTIHFTDTITGDLVNTAIVTGNPSDTNGNDLPNLSDVTDNDPSEVKDTSPVQPNIDLQTTVYPGHDGGASCQGQELVTGLNGDAVTYCYTVTNTGNTFLNDITIVDPQTGVEQTFNVLLPPGGTFTLSFETTITGDVVNTPTASGNPVDENGVDLPGLTDPTDTDPAAVNELAPAIQIDNTVYQDHNSGASCSGSEAVTGVSGSDVTYCFVVTNTGDTHLDEVVITNPDLGITLTVPINGTFAPGDSVTVHYDSTIVGDLVNNATVTGNPVEADGSDIPGAQNPNDSDPSEVNQTPLGANEPKIDLEKTVYLGHDGGVSCPGSEIMMGRGGAQATFCFKVTNTGNTHLNNVTVSDAALGINLTHNGTLAPNESVTLYAETTISGDLTNTASATGNPVDENGVDIPGATDPTDDDTAKVDEIAPSIDIQTTVYPDHNSGASCPGSENVAGQNGDAVTYCFVVTNNGDTPLGTITITDPDLGITINVPVPLNPGESTTVYYDGTINGPLTNTAVATGNPTDENGLDLPGVDDVTDNDPASVTENACITSIGDTIWLDLDGDGLQSDNEPGISGVTVNLIGAGPDGEFNTADDITNIAAQTTNGDGEYIFTGLSAGKYQVDVDESTLPTSYALTTGNEPAVVTVSECEENDQVDFGYTASVCERGVVYGVNDTGNRNSQFFKLDLGTKVASPIGPLHLEHDIEAIEIHPSTGTMYAIAGGGGPEDGKLFTVDKETGELSAIGTANADDPDEIVAAAFDQQGTLWAFRENQGLVNIDLNTGAATSASTSVTSGNWEGLAWDPDGEYLYGSEGRNLYRWDPDTDTTQQMCGADFLPYPTEALDFRFDGKMMGGSDKTGDTSLSIFEIDLAGCQVLPTDYDIEFNDVESLTSETCVESGEVDGNVVSDGRSPQALEGLDVTIMGDLNGDGNFAFSSVAKTNSTGKYEFANLPNGQYKLTVEGSDEEIEFSLTDNYDYQTPATISSTAEGNSGTFSLFLPAVTR